MSTANVTLKPPRISTAVFKITGVSPLVIHRFSAKTKLEMKQKMETGKAASSRKNREAKATDDLYKESKYVSPAGWEGFHAAAIRCAMINACRLVNLKMTLAKMSVFVEADGYDKVEPQIPLVRIYGKSEKVESMARVETGQPYVCVRAMYKKWYANVKIRWDEDQLTLEDIANLLTRVGLQVGICEGRPYSKNSAGVGWGCFKIDKK